MIIRRKAGTPRGPKLPALTRTDAHGLDSWTFLKLSRVGIALGIGPLSLKSVRATEIPAPQPGVPPVIRKNICTHCSVGCTVTAEVQNGVWTGQEPSWDSPINRGTHCAKGAAIRELAHSDRRLRYPMKLVDGQWQRLSWQQAIEEVGAKMLAVRERAGADSVY